MSLPDLSTRKGVVYASGASGTGLMVLASQYLKVYHPESSLHQYLEPEVVAVITGFLSYCSMLVISLSLKIKAYVKYGLNNKELERLAREHPDNPDVQKAKQSLVTARAKSLSR